MAGPLEGLLVIAVEQAVAAPLCTSRLCAAGARVIKVERDGGDFARAYDTAAKGESSYFTWINQGKESVVLDFKKPDDKALLQEMLCKADVLVQNLAPGALIRAGIDPDIARQSNPGLISCNISGYGESEKVAHLKAYDLLVQAEAGLLEVSGGPGDLGRIGISICDIGAGMSAHAAILEALIERGISRKGKSISISLFDVAAEWMTVPYIHQSYGKGAPERSGLHHPSIAPYGAYATRDGISTLVSIQNEREWVRFCEHVMLEVSLATDPLFENNNHRVNNRTALDTRILKTLAAIDAEEFRQRLANANLAFGAINSVAALTQHRALSTDELRNSEGESLSLPVSPLKANLSQPPAPARSPKIGEHSVQVRQEFAHHG